jgi:hypothetical protein
MNVWIIMGDSVDPDIERYIFDVCASREVAIEVLKAEFEDLTYNEQFDEWEVRFEHGHTSSYQIHEWEVSDGAARAVDDAQVDVEPG